MEITKDKPVIKALPEDFKKFVQWTNSQNEWTYYEDKKIWLSLDRDISFNGEEAITTDQLYQFYLLGK